MHHSGRQPDWPQRLRSTFDYSASLEAPDVSGQQEFRSPQNIDHTYQRTAVGSNAMLVNKYECR